MRCPHCDKTIASGDNFCRHCGKAITVQDQRQALAPPPERTRVMIPIDKSDFGPGEIVAQFESQSGTAWGAHIYTGSSSDSDRLEERPAGCPEWVEKNDWAQWFRRGLAVWDHGTQQIGTLLAGEALKLLAHDGWKSEGIAIVERHENVFTLDEPKRHEGKKKKKDAEAPPPPAEDPKPKYYEKERLRLTGTAAEEFVTYLRAQESLLRRLADEEEDLRFKFSLHATTVFARVLNQSQFEKFDPGSRKFAWTRRNFPRAFVCEMPPDRGTITLNSDGLWWLPVIERPGRMKYGWERFVSLEKAMDWIEQTIPKLRAEDQKQAQEWEQEEAEEKANLAALPKKDLAPYWIAPSALEPERITFRVIIELEYEPYHFKTTEISFGEHRRSDEEFYTPTMIARELRLEPSRVEIKQRSPYAGLYIIRSVTLHYDAQRAADQAQQLWDQSAMLEKHQEHKVICARYGFEEVETKYCVWLGGIDKPGDPWPKSQSRDDYLAELAMRQTLLYALDVNGYRQHIEISSKYVNDEKLLESMQRARAESPYLPAAVRAESRQWLHEHGIKGME